jgi:D-alanyl-D-alanine carboxypeptidase/D-alanyl-D-alanine-endopeptidase (penicillin-binding protein 4)
MVVRKEKSLLGIIAGISLFLCPNQPISAQIEPKCSNGIENILSRPEISRSHWGILIETLDSQQTIYNKDSERFFTPASNVKLLTSAAALLSLGADFRIRTPIYATGDFPTVNSLRIFGKGDPSLTGEHLRNLTKELKKLGLRRIKTLIIDNSYFRETGVNPYWEWQDLYQDYGTSYHSLVLNGNAFNLTLEPQQVGEGVKMTIDDPLAAKQWQIENSATTSVEDSPYQIKIETVVGKPTLTIQGSLAAKSEPDLWGLAIPDPPLYFGQSWRRILAEAGIFVDRVEIRHEFVAEAEEKEISAIESPPLSSLLEHLNQESDNLFGENLLQILAKETETPEVIEAVKKSLTKLGVNPESYYIVDGSGLSRRNLVSPEALVKLLQLMHKSSARKIYEQSLAIGGVNGTLSNRFKNTNLQGNVLAKTGTLQGALALSGYLNLSSSHPLVFSIIVNRSPQSPKQLRQVIDEIVLFVNNNCQSENLR